MRQLDVPVLTTPSHFSVPIKDGNKHLLLHRIQRSDTSN
jgi:hypothetical protein